jgi:hypothetical protein
MWGRIVFGDDWPLMAPAASAELTDDVRALHCPPDLERKVESRYAVSVTFDDGAPAGGGTTPWARYDEADRRHRGLRARRAPGPVAGSRR